MKVLDPIVQRKRDEVSRLDERLVRNVRPATRDLRLSLAGGRQKPALFAEFKRRDPATGDIPLALDLAAWAETLQQLGIGALVVDTDAPVWGGSRDDLIALDRLGMQMPLIRNDFIVDPLQLYESRAAGADALFLRPSLLDDTQLRTFLRLLGTMHMTGIPLVETPEELERVLPLDTPVVALSTGGSTGPRSDGATLATMATRIPASRAVIAGFDFDAAAAIAPLQGRVDAVCLGTGLLRSPDPAAFLMQWIVP